MKTRADILKKLENIEANAHRLLDEIATLKEELSGGSDSSKSKSSLSQSHKKQILERRRKIRGI